MTDAADARAALTALESNLSPANIEQLSFSNASGRLIFYSGNLPSGSPAGMQYMFEFVRTVVNNNGDSRWIESTPGGAIIRAQLDAFKVNYAAYLSPGDLAEYNLFKEQVWIRPSQLYAESARGSIYALIGNDAAGGFFQIYELPRLLSILE